MAIKGRLSNRFAISAGALALCLVPLVFGQDSDLRKRFEAEYQAWRAYMGERPFLELAIDNEHLNRMIEMGAPALPLLFEKIEKNPRGDFFLVDAVKMIVKRGFEKEEWPEGRYGDLRTEAALFLNWWKNRIKQTKDIFDRYCSARKKYLEENNLQEAEKQLDLAKKLGIAAMPYMIDKIKEGDLGFIRIVAELSIPCTLGTHEAYVKKLHPPGGFMITDCLEDKGLDENASQEECLDWWEKNKEKYLIVRDDITIEE